MLILIYVNQFSLSSNPNLDKRTRSMPTSLGCYRAPELSFLVGALGEIPLIRKNLG